MSINNIKIFENLLNLVSYTDIDEIINLDDIETNDLNIDISQVIQDEYIKSYAYDFIDFFDSINSRNDYELEAYDDTTEMTRYKTDLYNNRMSNIKDLKSYFLANINNIKRFKGTKEYIEFIFGYYLNMKYYHQFELNVGSELTTGNLVEGSRYVIMSTETDYFGSNKKSGNIITTTNSLTISSDNSVKLITSTDTIKINNQLYNLEFNKKYLIVKCEDNYFFDGNKPGNTFIYNSNITPDILWNVITKVQNVVIEIPTVVVEKIKPIIYTIQSIISEDEYLFIIKPITHPVGWLSYYYILDEINNETTFLQPQNISITEGMSYLNLNYYAQNIVLNSNLTNTLIDYIGNNNLSDMSTLNHNLNNMTGTMKFDLVYANFSESDLIANQYFEHILKFSNELRATEIGVYDVSDYIYYYEVSNPNYDINIAHDIYRLSIKLSNPTLWDVSGTKSMVIMILKGIQDIDGNTLQNDIEISFDLTVPTISPH